MNGRRAPVLARISPSRLTSAAKLPPGKVSTKKTDPSFFSPLQKKKKSSLEEELDRGSQWSQQRLNLEAQPPTHGWWEKRKPSGSPSLRGNQRPLVARDNETASSHPRFPLLSEGCLSRIRSSCTKGTSVWETARNVREARWAQSSVGSVGVLKPQRRDRLPSYVQTEQKSILTKHWWWPVFQNTHTRAHTRTMPEPKTCSRPPLHCCENKIYLFTYLYKAPPPQATIICLQHPFPHVHLTLTPQQMSFWGSLDTPFEHPGFCYIIMTHKQAVHKFSHG